MVRLSDRTRRWSHHVVKAMTIVVVAATFSREVAAQVTPAKPSRRDSVRTDSLVKQARQKLLTEAHVVQLHEVAVVAGGLLLAAALDEPVQRYVQRHRTNTSDDISSVFRQQGEPVYYAVVSLGTLGAGIVLKDANVRRAGGRIVASVLFSTLASEGMKRLVGRSRPNEKAGAFRFHPFTSLQDSAGTQTRSAMPSGHTTAAFAVAASLADDVNNTLVDVLLYTVATGTAYSRINDNRHWLSDTFAGAVLGITTAKVVSGRWRIFGLRPPEFLITPTGTPSLSLTVEF